MRNDPVGLVIRAIIALPIIAILFIVSTPSSARKQGLANYRYAMPIYRPAQQLPHLTKIDYQTAPHGTAFENDRLFPDVPDGYEMTQGIEHGLDYWKAIGWTFRFYIKSASVSKTVYMVIAEKGGGQKYFYWAWVEFGVNGEPKAHADDPFPVQICSNGDVVREWASCGGDSSAANNRPQ